MGRVDNIERRFLNETSPETVTILKGCLKWVPQARFTATEALGRSSSKYAATAERWWKESPRAIEKELLPTYPEVRNGLPMESLEHRSKAMQAKKGVGSMAGAKDAASDYVFDFEDGTRRPAKRPRAR